MNKMLQQVQQMQADMAKAQEELANETVEASVGGGMVTVTATGAGEIVAVKIRPRRSTRTTRRRSRTSSSPASTRRSGTLRT